MYLENLSVNVNILTDNKISRLNEEFVLTLVTKVVPLY